MTPDSTAFEQDILNFTQEKIAKWRKRFDRVRVTISGPELRREGSAEGYDSEIEVYFRDSTGIFDVVTFFVYRDGKRVASREEVEAWLTEDLGDVLSRRLQTIGGQTGNQS